MYTRILVAVEHSDADQTILAHVRELAQKMGSSLLLVHVADGWVARHYDEMQLRESEEMRDDREYLERVATDLRQAGLAVDYRLAMGDPAAELIRMAAEEKVDLIAMSTHGHRLIADLVHGTTVDKVRHEVRVPVLLLRAH